MSHGFGLMIESLVAILLLVTIGYCILLNERLKRLKADEQALKATIAELITATEIAERAVAGLEGGRAGRRRHAGRAPEGGRPLLRRSDRQVRAARLLHQLGCRASWRAARPLLEEPAAAPPPPAAPDPKAVAAAAQVFAERARKRRDRVPLAA